MTCTFGNFVIVNSHDVFSPHFAAFILLVIVRYFRQNVKQQVEDGEALLGEKGQKQALVVAEPGEEQQQQALVVAEKGSRR